MKGLTSADIAAEAGVSVQSVLQARVDLARECYRSPPPRWQTAIKRLAERRARELDELARSVDECP